MSALYPFVRRRGKFLLLLLVLLGGLALVVSGGSPGAPPAPSPKAAPSPDSAEIPRPVHRIPLNGPLARADAEVSGMAWHGEHLVLLPQHPFRMSGRPDAGLLFTLSKAEIDAHLSGRRDGPLTPRPLPLAAPALRRRSPIYEGCEAIAFAGSRAYLATEALADTATGAMYGYLFAGDLRGDTLRLDTRRRAALPPQTQASNMAYEALLAAPGRILAFYEANGRNVNPRARVAAFSPTLRAQRTWSFPALEYRLTDATAPDAEGRFWVMNYFYPAERGKLLPASDRLAPASSSTPGKEAASVERLVEYRLGAGALRRTQTPPLRLALQPGVPRNWEGVARFESRAHGPGFLLATDEYPETILGFVAAEAPAAEQ